MDVQPPSAKYMVWIEYVILHQKNDKVNHGTIPAIHIYPHHHLRQRRSEVLPTQNGLVSRTIYRTPWFLGSHHPPRRTTCFFKMSTLRCDFSYERNIEAWISNCQKQENYEDSSNVEDVWVLPQLPFIQNNIWISSNLFESNRFQLYKLSQTIKGTC